MNKLFKYILEYYNDGSEKVDSSTELYKVLTKILFLEENNKIDRLLNWNISRVMRCNTIEDKLWLM